MKPGLSDRYYSYKLALRYQCGLSQVHRKYLLALALYVYDYRLCPNNSLNTDNSKEDEEYIKCHSLAKKKYTECIDSHCQCYYIHVVSRQCIKLCTTYVCLSIETKRASLTHSAPRNLI